MQHKHPTNNMARRQFARIALGSAVAVVLTACGGSDGSDSDSQTNLLDVYNKLEDGMGPEEVTALVGRTAEEIGGSAYNWRNEDDEYLNIDFNFGRGTQLSGAQWGVGGTNRFRSKVFEEV